MIHALKEKQLSKYSKLTPGLGNVVQSEGRSDRVLVVDQAENDLSIVHGLASRVDFELMLEAARDENPGAEIIVKTHPSSRAGNLSERKELLSGCRILAKPCNPWQILGHVSSVYTVSSLLGFEAMMAGKKVRCFGMPFYAGWGLSHDEKKCSRRAGVRPTLEHIMVAAYGEYCRYVDPYTNTLSTFSKIVTIMEKLRDTANT